MLKTDESPAPSVSLPWPLSALSVSIGDNEHRIMDQILRILAILPTRVARCHRSVRPTERSGRSCTAALAGGLRGRRAVRSVAGAAGACIRTGSRGDCERIECSPAALEAWRCTGRRPACPPARPCATSRAAPALRCTAYHATRQTLNITFTQCNKYLVLFFVAKHCDFVNAFWFNFNNIGIYFFKQTIRSIKIKKKCFLLRSHKMWKYEENVYFTRYSDKDVCRCQRARWRPRDTKYKPQVRPPLGCKLQCNGRLRGRLCGVLTLTNHLRAKIIHVYQPQTTLWSLR